MRKIDMSSVNPANATVGGAMMSAAMTADHGNPLINAAVGAGVGLAVGLGARAKQAHEQHKGPHGHRVLNQRQFGENR